MSKALLLVRVSNFKLYIRNESKRAIEFPYYLKCSNFFLFLFLLCLLVIKETVKSMPFRILLLKLLSSLNFIVGKYLYILIDDLEKYVNKNGISIYDETPHFNKHEIRLRWFVVQNRWQRILSITSDKYVYVPEKNPVAARPPLASRVSGWRPIKRGRFGLRNTPPHAHLRTLWNVDRTPINTCILHGAHSTFVRVDTLLFRFTNK